jgi:hypothetical protein
LSARGGVNLYIKPLIKRNEKEEKKSKKKGKRRKEFA